LYQPVRASDIFLYCFLKKLSMGPFISDNSGDPADTTIPQTDFDSMRMEQGMRQDFLDYSPGCFPAALIAFLNDIHR